MVAVTVGLGQAGRQLAKVLINRGETVRCLIPESAEVIEGVECIMGDVFDMFALANLLKGVEAVYHCDHKVTFDHRFKDQLYRYNVEGTANVVNAALSGGVEKLLFLSSVHAIGDKANGSFFDEASTWGDLSSAQQYGWSMHLAERELWRGNAEGLKTVIVQAGTAIFGESGESEWRIIADRCIREAGYFTGSIALIDGRDLAKVMISLMEGPFESEKFIAYADQVSFQALRQELSIIAVVPSNRKMDHKVLRRRARRQRIIQFFNPDEEAIYTRSLAHLLSSDRKYSNRKLNSALGHAFIPWKEAIAGYRASVDQKN